MDGAVANQFMHWTDIPTTFSQLQKFLKQHKSVVWNSASHFYEDSQFPSLEYGFRYNDFLNYVLKEISKKCDVKDSKTLSRPNHNIESIREITSKQGFETEQVGTCLVPVDLQIFIRNHVPVFVRQLVTSELSDVAGVCSVVARKAIQDARNILDLGFTD